MSSANDLRCVILNNTISVPSKTGNFFSDVEIEYWLEYGRVISCK